MIRSSVFAFVSVLFLCGCAPRVPSPGQEDGPGDPAPTPVSTQPPAPTPPPTPTPEPVAQATPVPQATMDPENPDWELRYRQLFAHHAPDFVPPEIGQVYEVTLSGGNTRSGKLIAVTEDSIDLAVANGLLTINVNAMAEESRGVFFRDHFAHQRAVEQGKREYQSWKRMRELASRPTPTPTPPRVARELIPHTMPGGGNDGLHTRHRPDPDAPPPKNEGSSGRVWQVDRYLRQNSAVPHSIRYKQWGRVQPHGDGYKVRVQYSVESAGGLGTNHEDMMFFMHADGNVYRRAPVK